MHPLIELFLNPTAGAAGFNLVSIGFYGALIILIIAGAIEHEK